MIRLHNIASVPSADMLDSSIKTIPVLCKNNTEVLLQYANTPIGALPLIVQYFDIVVSYKSLLRLPLVFGNDHILRGRMINTTFGFDYIMNYGCIIDGNSIDKKILLLITCSTDPVAKNVTIYLDKELLEPQHKKLYNALSKHIHPNKLLNSDFSMDIKICYLRNIEQELFPKNTLNEYRTVPTIPEDLRLAILNYYGQV